MKSPGTIEAKFKRSKTKAELTKLWSEIDSYTKDIILKKIRLGLREVPILYFYSNPLLGWVLTDKRLLILGNDETTQFSLNEFEKVELQKLFDGETNKMECSSIQLFTKFECVDLSVENGTWPIIFSLFQFIISK
ncbi:MAG TPA: hypothetical protein VK671_06135 [Mucilaginibacter sp.]|jgi:hypothetical protein|nr:hypothetical protein [Mucilaginibacter sp.]